MSVDKDVTVTEGNFLVLSRKTKNPKPMKAIAKIEVGGVTLLVGEPQDDKNPIFFQSKHYQDQGISIPHKIIEALEELADVARKHGEALPELVRIAMDQVKDIDPEDVHLVDSIEQEDGNEEQEQEEISEEESIQSDDLNNSETSDDQDINDENK